MKCDVCGKKKATVHLTELIDHQVMELHICEECAREKSVQMEQQFGLADLLAGLSDFGKPGGAADAGGKPVPEKALVCEACGTTYQEFKKYGRLGCSECYQSFENQLGSLLKKIHGASKHSGKIPPQQAASSEAVSGGTDAPGIKAGSLDELKQRLQQAVLAEDYERAAELRDRIRSKEKKD